MTPYLIFLLSLSLNAFAVEEFKFLPLDTSIDINEVPQGIQIDETPKTSYLHPKLRDEKLNRLFPSELNSYDDVDRDILYKSILHYSKTDILKKYPFIKESNYQRVKSAFK